MPNLSVLEFFHGIGGLRVGLENAAEDLGGNIHCDVLAAFDISSLCAETYDLNFGPGRTVQKDVKSLSDSFFARSPADLWIMSPPCQPYTVRGKELDTRDPRAAGLLRLMAYLESAAASLPRGILLENVPGFVSSGSLAQVRQVLLSRGYQLQEHELCPTNFGVPNRRRRFYLLAVRGGRFEQQALNTETLERPPPLSNFLDGASDSGYFDSTYALPGHYQRYASALDVVRPTSTESDCFTGAYGRFAKGSGSVLDCGDHGQRLFSSREITRLHCFPAGYTYPDSVKEQKRYQLIGNSVNVRVVTELSRSLLQAVAKPCGNRG
mmetsp:Transcript_1911/g.5761  ORF Transcript_1911/g.5761 Transcript_1911/m.5761 type:complete len:323 (+) Transcript_1911:55-1023(+)